MRETFEKLEATAAKLRGTQEGAARELIEQQVRPASPMPDNLPHADAATAVKIMRSLDT